MPGIAIAFTPWSSEPLADIPGAPGTPIPPRKAATMRNSRTHAGNCIVAAIAIVGLSGAASTAFADKSLADSVTTMNATIKEGQEAYDNSLSKAAKQLVDALWKVAGLKIHLLLP